MKIADVIVVMDGRRRLRGITELADSIQQNGLINPITVTPARRRSREGSMIAALAKRSLLRTKAGAS